MCSESKQNFLNKKSLPLKYINFNVLLTKPFFNIHNVKEYLGIRFPQVVFVWPQLERCSCPRDCWNLFIVRKQQDRVFCFSIVVIVHFMFFHSCVQDHLWRSCSFYFNRETTILDWNMVSLPHILFDSYIYLEQIHLNNKTYVQFWQFSSVYAWKYIYIFPWNMSGIKAWGPWCKTISYLSFFICFFPFHITSMCHSPFCTDIIYTM